MRCGPARTETINGREAGRDGKFACGAVQKEGGGRGAKWGGRGEARAQLGAPARPPHEPTAARGLVELRELRARALYRAREPRGGGAKRTGGGD